MTKKWSIAKRIDNALFVATSSVYTPRVMGRIQNGIYLDMRYDGIFANTVYKEIIDEFK